MTTLSIPEPSTTELASGDAGALAQPVYQLLWSLGSGSYGAAYAGERSVGSESHQNEPVEVRRLADSLTDRQRSDLATRLKLNGLLANPAARNAKWVELAAGEPGVVFDDQCETTLADWLDTPAAVLNSTLQLLATALECVVEAHGLGLTHGAMARDAIAIKDGQPRLDFTGFQQTESSSAAHRFEIGSPEAKLADNRAAARLVDELFDAYGFHDACVAISHREAAKRKQLCAALGAEQNDGYDLAQLVESLRALANPEGQAPSQRVVDSTCELPAGPAPLPASDSTSEIVVRPPAVDSTSELGLAGHAPEPLVGNPTREPQAGDRLGRYKIEKKLGQGGMGAVFKASDLGDGKTVAIKVLSEAAMTRGNAVQRFEKEARLLASVNNPYVTNLIEVNTEGRHRFIALEFVDGIDLKRVLDKQGPLPERTALSVAADVARALVDAHQREIVHRDIKPENVLLVDIGEEDSLGDTPPQAKLTDFGIARHIDQSESLAVTQAGALIGTPIYMSPEQCKGQGGVAPPSDVYSLGVTLFELLTGNPPFAADDPMALAGMHCFDAPPAIRKLCPDVSEPTAELINKCLAKRPADRFADAAHVLTEIDRLLRGETSEIALRPVVPKHDVARVVGNQMKWRLQATPEALWPYVSNTERLNRAIGLPPVIYRTETDPNSGVRRFGTIRLAGFSMSWEEHPFEWIEGRRMSVLREFDGGPFQWFVSTVELVLVAEGHTELTHTVRILPRNWFGGLIARIETGRKCQRSLEKVYSRIDDVLSKQKRGPAPIDAFEQPAPLKREQRDALLTRLAELKATGANADVADALGDYLMTAPDQSVAKMRPIALAQELNLDEPLLLDTCLQAVVQGLLRMEWDILCPTCRVAADSRDSLKQLTAHTHCEACNYDFQSSLADAVELVFRADGDIRNTDVGRYCVGGPWHAPHVVAQTRLEPGERVELEVALSEGDYLLRGPRLTQSFALHVQPSGAPSQQLFVLAKGSEDSRGFNLRAGKQLLTIENGFGVQQVVRIERTISRDDVLTAARASALPRFRELFPGEVLDEGRLVEADQVTLLAATIASIDTLYEQQGDAQAFAIVQQHQADIEVAVRQHRGEVVKVIGETVVASFHDARQAVRAAFAMCKQDASDPAAQALQPAVGVHRGPALVTTANNRLDYFGATARQATALPGLAGPGISLTESVFADVEVSKLLAELSSQRDMRGELETIGLPGKPNQLIQRFPAS